MLSFGAETPAPGPTPIGEVCLPVAGCIPLSTGISEGGLIVLFVVGLLIILAAAAFFVAVRYGSTILGFVKEAKAEAAAARKEAIAAKGEAAAARFGINNNHSTNVRDDIDGNHTEVIELVKMVAARVENIADDVGGIRSEMRDVRRIAGDDRRRVADLDARLTRHVEASE